MNIPEAVQLYYLLTTSVAQEMVRRALLLANCERLPIGSVQDGRTVYFAHPQGPYGYQYMVAKNLNFCPPEYVFTPDSDEQKLCQARLGFDKTLAESAMNDSVLTALYNPFCLPGAQSPKIEASFSDSCDIVSGALKWPLSMAVSVSNMHFFANNLPAHLQDVRSKVKLDAPFVVALPAHLTGVEDMVYEGLLRQGLFRTPIYEQLARELETTLQCGLYRDPIFHLMSGKLPDDLQPQLVLQQLMPCVNLQGGDDISVDEFVLRNAAADSGWKYERYEMQYTQEPASANLGNLYVYWLYVHALISFADENRELNLDEHCGLAQAVAEVVSDNLQKLVPLPMWVVYHILRAV